MSDSKQRTIEFLASFSPVLAAIKITGDDNGMRIQLDIPETELGTAAKLLLMRGKVLKVTVAEFDNDKVIGNVQDTTVKRTKAKRRNG